MVWAALLIAASAIFVNCFLVAYAVETFIDIKIKVIEIIKKPKESGIRDPRSDFLSQSASAIDLHTQRLMLSGTGQYLQLP